MLLLLPLLAAAADDPPAMTTSTGNPIRWSQWPVQYDVDPQNGAGLSDAEAVAAAVAASSTWQAVTAANLDIQYRGQTSGATFGYEDGDNVVLFQPDWTLDSNLIAWTSVWSTPDGDAVAFDIEVNTRDYDWSTEGASDAEDLQGALTHEMGHALGLGHIVDDEGATMYPSTVVGQTERRDLAASDVAAIVATYPGGDTSDTDDTGSPNVANMVAGDLADSFSDAVSSCNSAGTTSGAGLAGFALVLVACLKRREPSC